jgi:hypothetical protein
MTIRLTEAALRRVIQEVLDESDGLNEEGYLDEDIEAGGEPKKAAPPDSSKGSASNSQLQTLKTNVKMMFDAAQRAQQALDNLQSKEALRWAQKTGEFASKAVSVVKKN